MYGAEVDADPDILRLNRVHDGVAVRREPVGLHENRIEVVRVQRPRTLRRKHDLRRGRAGRRRGAAFSATRRLWNASILLNCDRTSAACRSNMLYL